MTDLTIQETFLKNLEREMSKKNVTYYQIAKNTGISNSTFANWRKRNANPTIDKLVEVSRYLDVSADKLLGLPEKDPPEFSEDEIFLIECYRRADDIGREMIRRECTAAGNGEDAELSDSRGSKVPAKIC